MKAHPGSDHSPRTHRLFRCACGRQLFFNDHHCPGCGHPLGYLVSRRNLYRLWQDADTHTWIADFDALDQRSRYRRCANHDSPAACNWLLPSELNPAISLCQACRLNRIIPDLSQDRSALLWSRMERAKRRVISQLIGLGLPVADRVTEDPERGIAFDFLCALPDQSPVSTGHAGGIITIDIEEADDTVREHARRTLNEPYRTLVGHFRHELGHYYWTRLIQGTGLEASCRQVFGDERGNYQAALEAHRNHGPSPDWSIRYVSAYASMHPSEDWAESWAHYLHMRDVLDTAVSMGVDDDAIAIDAAPLDLSVLWNPRALSAQDFMVMVQRWLRIVGVMNEMSHAMGQPDFYPFVLPQAALAKLHFIHDAIEQAVDGAAS